MKKYRKAEVDVIDDIICDMCDISCKKGKDCFEYSDFISSWGYNSRKDGERWSGMFCEDCSDRIKDFVESGGKKLEIKETYLGWGIYYKK